MKIMTDQYEKTPPDETWKILIRDLTVRARVGIYAHEMDIEQDLLINLTCDYRAPAPKTTGDHRTDVSQVFCYDQLIQKIKAILRQDHIYFLETLAQMITKECLRDPRAQAVTVRIEKPDALPNTKYVGVEIQRFSS
ncbi:MAG: dihydroneopterin aldolase [Alphaproteobacteria bacterium]|nr:dihydroneopterin aldolase [Alphaproteobacteria bacterium]